MKNLTLIPTTTTVIVVVVIATTTVTVNTNICHSGSSSTRISTHFGIYKKTVSNSSNNSSSTGIHDNNGANRNHRNRHSNSNSIIVVATVLQRLIPVFIVIEGIIALTILSSIAMVVLGVIVLL